MVQLNDCSQDISKNIDNNKYYFKESYDCELKTHLFLGNYCISKFCCIPMPSNKARKNMRTESKNVDKKSNSKNQKSVYQNKNELNVSKTSSNNSCTLKAPGEVKVFDKNQNNKILENDKGITKTVLVTEMIKNLKKEKTSEEDKENIQEPDISNRNTEKEIKNEIPIVKDDKLSVPTVLDSYPENKEKDIKGEIPKEKDDKLNINDVLNNDLENEKKEIKEILVDLVNQVETLIKARDGENEVNI